jgi:hypothetical protein
MTRVGCKGPDGTQAGSEVVVPVKRWTQRVFETRIRTTPDRASLVRESRRRSEAIVGPDHTPDLGTVTAHGDDDVGRQAVGGTLADEPAGLLVEVLEPEFGEGALPCPGLVLEPLAAKSVAAWT